MKARTLLEVLTLATNVYLISRDEELKNQIAGSIENGKKKFHDLINEFSSEEKEDGGSDVSDRLLSKLKQAQQELEDHIRDVAASVYDKMNIARHDELKVVLQKVSSIEKQLEQIEKVIARNSKHKS